MASAESLAYISICLRSKVARRIAKSLSAKPIGITALCRRAGCSRRDAIKYLTLMVKAGAVAEERYGRLRLYRLLSNAASTTLKEAVRILEGWTLDEHV